MLPKERQCLQDNLKAFEYKVKQYVSPVSGKKPRNGPPATGGDSGYRAAQALGGDGQPTYSAVLSSGSQATSPSSSSGNTLIIIMINICDVLLL